MESTPPSGGSTGMAMFPDLQHKMSKKIAQLTKVIYMLHSKNDEHEAELQGLEDAYESDIDKVPACPATGLLPSEITVCNRFSRARMKRSTSFGDNLSSGMSNPRWLAAACMHST